MSTNDMLHLSTHIGFCFPVLWKPSSHAMSGSSSQAPLANAYYGTNSFQCLHKFYALLSVPCRECPTIENDRRAGEFKNGWVADVTDM